MPYQSGFQTNSRTELIALRAAEAANYLRIGSRKYFKDQLVGKRNGHVYSFVVKDTGVYQEGIDLTNGATDAYSGNVGKGASKLQERSVKKQLKVGNVLIETNMLNKVVDADWDDEIAQPNGKKLINGVVRSAVADDLVYQNTAFVGTGFQPLFKGQNFLKSVTDSKIYGFTNPMVNSVLSSNGQSFDPAESNNEFSNAGLMGKLADVEYRANQFMPVVSVDAALLAKFDDLTKIEYVAGAADTDDATIKLYGMDVALPKGFVFWIHGVYACDLVGDKTSALKAFIVAEDGKAAGTGQGQSGSADYSTITIRPIYFAGEGTKEVVQANGAAFGADEASARTAFHSALASATVANLDLLPVGDYFGGFIRADGAMEFESIGELDASNADTKKETVEGLTVIENRAVDTLKGSNLTRWSTVTISGIIDPRCVTYVLVRDAVINQVRVNP